MITSHSVDPPPPPRSAQCTSRTTLPTNIAHLHCCLHSFPGFSRLRMHSKGGSPVAFVEYQEVRCAAQAMSTLQGSFLLSSDRGAIRIEYAKSKMSEVRLFILYDDSITSEGNLVLINPAAAMHETLIHSFQRLFLIQLIIIALGWWPPTSSTVNSRTAVAGLTSEVVDCGSWW